MLHRVQPDRRDEDVFPKHYRLNTIAATHSAFPATRFRNASYVHNPTPAYHGNRALLFRLIDLYQRLPFDTFGTSMHIFVQKIG